MQAQPRRQFMHRCAYCAMGLGLWAPGVWAREGVEVGETSKFANLVSAEEVEKSALQQYRQMLQQAASKNALGPDNHPQVTRLRDIARRIIPNSYGWNARARQWQWEVNLIGSNQINAFCMPGGKIAFYTAILDQLKLTDDEVAMVMGHEMAHALREHARERMGKTTATRFGASLLSGLLGLGNGCAVMLRHPMFYEVAIACAYFCQALVLLALLFVLVYVGMHNTHEIDLHFPIAGTMWMLGALGLLPRVEASTKGEGHERRYFYGSVWAVCVAPAIRRCRSCSTCSGRAMCGS